MARSAGFGILSGLAAAALLAAGSALGLTTADFVWPVATACLVISAALSFSIQGVAELVVNRTRTLRTRTEEIRRDVGDIHGLVRLAPYTETLPLPFGGGYALTGDAAAVLAHETVLGRPKLVVELGSGVSTLIVAQILARQGSGRLVSIDHDPLWAETTRRNLAALGLTKTAQVVEAPLQSQDIQGRTVEWYGIPAGIMDSLNGVELLIVDGPPQNSETVLPSRYPAFPVFADRMADTATIFVDDHGREREREMVRAWLGSASGWTSHELHTVDGVCILKRDFHTATDGAAGERQARAESGAGS